jgi:phosphate:Na+ symporter
MLFEITFLNLIDLSDMDSQIFDLWKFIAGIGIFLFGMNQLEQALTELAGRSFKELLQRFTNKIWKGILIGALITAILQSSSLVTLMILAFLGAKLINLRNSIGVILGANLGTTVTAWIVASLGFKLDISGFSMPFIGLGSLMAIFLYNRPALKNIGYFGLGFGLLFLGLDFMKTSIEELALQIDLSEYVAYGKTVFLFIGIVVTALIQSSSAMIVIALSAVNAEVVGLTEAAVLLIGANIGTTITVFIGAARGGPDKKRLAFAHFLFNGVTGTLAFFFVHQLIAFSYWVYSAETVLIQLVLFNTLMNALGILLFYPFVNRLEKFLAKRFKSSEPKGPSVYIKNVDTKVPAIAIDAMEKELESLLQIYNSFIGHVLGTKPSQIKKLPTWQRILSKSKDSMSYYNKIKLLEDELTHYHLQLQEENMNDKEAEKLTSLMLSLRQIVYSAKDIKDVKHNFIEIRESQVKFLQDILSEIQQSFLKFIEEVYQYHQNGKNGSKPEWLKLHQQFYDDLINKLYKNSEEIERSDMRISTLTNMVKQLSSAMENLGLAFIHWKIGEYEVIEINEINQR